MQLDQIFRLAAGAVEGLVQPFGRAVIEIGDDEPDVETEPRRLDASDGAPLFAPGTSPVARFGEAAHDILVVERALGAHGVGRFIDFLAERLRAWKSEHIVDAVVLAPSHRLGPSVMAVAAEQDAGCRPPGADAAHEPAQMSTNLDARGRLARTQDDRHGPARLGVIDMDRQEAALVIAVEQRAADGRGRHRTCRRCPG